VSCSDEEHEQRDREADTECPDHVPGPELVGDRILPPTR
jgi:hypothetical protein